MENVVLPEHCNQCKNKCPAQALQCGRGRAYFARLQRGEKEFCSQNPLTRLLVQCGQIAKHKGEMLQAHGVEESAMFQQGLSPEEQAQLLALLQKQVDAWEREHAQRHQGGHHGPDDGKHGHPKL